MDASAVGTVVALHVAIAVFLGRLPAAKHTLRRLIVLVVVPGGDEAGESLAVIP